jgi:phosphatidylinositol glycan class U
MDVASTTSSMSGSPVLQAVAAVAHYLPAWLSWLFPALVFTVVDVVTGLLLKYSCLRSLAAEEPCPGEVESEANMEAEDRPKMGRLELMDPSSLPDTVLSLYLLNPVTLFQCAMKGGVGAGLLPVASALAAAHSGRRTLAGVCIALACLFFDFRSAMLLLPTVIVGRRRGRCSSPTVDASLLPGREDVLVFLGFCAAMLFAGPLLGQHVYDFALFGLLARDLSPSVGTQWYLFQLMFERFRNYFAVVFGGHAFLYVLPMCIRLGSLPHALADATAMTMLLFRSAPSLVDFVFMLCLVISHPRIVARMRMLTFIGVGIWIPLLMLPVMIHVWLNAGTGNANYLYFQSLAYQVFLTLVVLQFAGGMMRRRKALATAAKTGSTQ